MSGPRALDEADFVREKLHGGGRSALRRYRDLAVGEGSGWLSLIRYELITILFGYIPGTPGLLLRRIFFPFLFRKVGRKVVFGRAMTIRCARNIELGDKVVLDDYVLIDGRGAGEERLILGDRVIVNRGCSIRSKVGPLHIGADCTIGAQTMLSAQGGVHIGEWVSFAGGCKVGGGIFEPKPEGDDSMPPFRRVTKGAIRIGDFCVIASNAIVLDGARIGRGCMIGAGAVVMQDVPDDATYSARPGLVLKRLKS